MIISKICFRCLLALPLMIFMGLFFGDRLTETKVLSQTAIEDDRGWGGQPSQQAERISTDRKVALVIGNADYKVGSPLRNPVNDANDMAAALEELGFDVLLGTNLSLQEMDKLVSEFHQELENGSVGVFYYAGHGVQSKGENYFLPVDANINIEENLRYRALPMGEVLNYMQEADNDVNIVIIDACRDNPYARSWRSNTRGLASVENTRGMLIAYATAPGDVAADGAGRNGVFTGALLDHIRRPGLEVNALMTAVRGDVYRKTEYLQWPWTASSLIGDFSFSEKPKTTATIPDSPSLTNPMQSEQESISAVEESVLLPENDIRLSSENLGESVPIKNNSEVFTEDLGDGVTLEMVKIPTGHFLMGSLDGEGNEDEYPQHRVVIRESFYMGKYEVTQAQWEVVMGENPSFNKNPRNPVEKISWQDIQQFLERLNELTGKKYRLPGEAEWEYAAGGGATSSYFFGNNEHELKQYGWCNQGSLYDGARAVGQLKPNQYGLYDVLGNVSEWTQDGYEDNYSVLRSQSPHSQGSLSGVLRGGSWMNKPSECRTSSREEENRSILMNWSSGFRLSLSSSSL